MSASKLDVESSYLNARAKFAEWREEYAQKYLEPSAEQELLAIWRTAPPELKAQVKQMDPQRYAAVEKLVAQLEVKNA